MRKCSSVIRNLIHSHHRNCMQFHVDQFKVNNTHLYSIVFIAICKKWIVVIKQMEYPQPQSQFMPTAPTAAHFAPSPFYQPNVSTPIILQPNFILSHQQPAADNVIFTHHQQPSKINWIQNIFNLNFFLINNSKQIISFMFHLEYIQWWHPVWIAIEMCKHDWNTIQMLLHIWSHLGSAYLGEFFVLDFFPSFCM